MSWAVHALRHLHSFCEKFTMSVPVVLCVFLVESSEFAFIRVSIVFLTVGWLWTIGPDRELHVRPLRGVAAAEPRA